LNTVTAFGKVCLVRKRGGIDSGSSYAMKIMEKDVFIENKITKFAMDERAVFEKVTDSPFLVGLKYAFQTQSKLFFVMGEYIKLICMIVRTV
jgi:serine/threonine protein kinase